MHEKIIGTEILEGDIRLGHTFFEVEVIKELISQHQPNIFVEIGVHEGGLSRLLLQWIKENDLNIKYLGIEYDENIPKVKDDYTQAKDAFLIFADCFSDNITQFISESLGKKLIYCDGGNKVKEIAHYAPLLEIGDAIMTHDYNDGTRGGKGLPDVIRAEVVPQDVEFLDNDPNFRRVVFPELYNTRIVVFEKINE